MDKLNTYFDKENRFAEIFNPENGFYLRTGILDEHKIDTGIDPFMRNYPSLLDIGIMGHCKNAKECTIGCYQGKLSKPNMSLDVDVDEKLRGTNLDQGGPDYEYVAMTFSTLLHKYPDIKLSEIKKLVADEFNKAFGTNFTEKNIGYIEEGWMDN